LHPLSNLAGRNGVSEVFAPGQGAAEEAERLPCACGALQNAILFLNGVKNRGREKRGDMKPPNPPKTSTTNSGIVLPDRNSSSGGESPMGCELIHTLLP
jgi:hypothetical protein